MKNWIFKKHVNMKKTILFIIISFSFLGIYGNDKEKNNLFSKIDKNVITILSTDLSIAADPDDWFDSFLFLNLEGLNPSGIILADYATTEVEDYASKFLRILQKEEIPIRKGVQQKMKIVDGALWASDFHEGAEFILETMRETNGKVRLIVVGSLRDAALAYTKDSILFSNKIESVYFCGGNWNNLNERNLGHDRIASSIILNAPIPIVWTPGTWSNRILFPGEYEEKLNDYKDPLSMFLAHILKEWRIFRGENFLKTTDQFPSGKNLWSFPALLHASGILPETMTFMNGDISLSLEKEKISFRRHPDGKDLMINVRDHDAIIEWFWDYYRDLILTRQKID